jgi:adenine specific DNA methylase Mod
MENLHIKSLTDANKGELNDLASILLEVSEGRELDLYIFSKKIEYLSKVIQEIAHEYALSEAEKMKGESIYNSKVEIKDVGVKYDYNVCKYAPYDNLLSNKKEIETELKVMENLLKSINKPTTIVDEETGDVMNVSPPLRTSKTSIVLTIK